MPVLYAASDEPTALAEKKYHRAQFLRNHHTPPASEKHLALTLSVAGRFHAYHPVRYGASQALGRELWDAGSPGIAYTSVRRPQGDCAAVFSPQTITSCARGAIYEFHWDGKQIAETFRLEPRK